MIKDIIYGLYLGFMIAVLFGLWVKPPDKPSYKYRDTIEVRDKETGEAGEDWPAGRGCSECGKGEMVYRPIEPSLAVTFVVQRSSDGEIWEDYLLTAENPSKAEAVSVASEQHERYHLTRKFRVIRRVEKVEWEP